MTRTTACILLLAAALLAGCGGDPRFRTDTLYLGGFGGRAKEKKRAAHDDVSYWDGDGRAGKASITIRLSEQKAYFFKGNELAGISMISTGREGFDTPTGSFKLIQKDRDHLSNLYGDYIDRDGNVLMKDIDIKKDKKPPGAIFDGAKMPFFMRIVGGVGMHEGFLPGYAASHGCIRMPGFMAAKFFENVSKGTPVQIVP